MLGRTARLSNPRPQSARMPPTIEGDQGMADLPRLNGVIRALEAGQHALTCFAPAEINSAVAMSTSKFDGCVFEMEHNPWDGRLLRDCLQYMLNRAQIAKAASVVPAVTPMVRIPVERRRDGAMAGQAGARHGLLWHRVPAYFDGRGGRQCRRRLPLSAAEDPPSTSSPPASAATGRPPRRATGA